MDGPEQDCRYWAFISYSHQDRVWGDWLHSAIETYRVPRRLVGRRTAMGTIPRRLFPVFCDRDELPSSANLGDAINECLQASRFQLVICSPRAAQSKWVNAEVRYFKSLGRESRVLCLIVDGEPGAAERECFPETLRHAVHSDGTLGAPVEVIAADARANGDGREHAKLKLIAGMLGVGFDELRQRERQRRFWQRLQALAAGALLVAGVVAAWQGFEHYKQQQSQALKVERLYEQGRQALLAQQSGRAALYLTAALREGRDTPALRFMLGQAMLPVEALSPLRLAVDGRVTHPAFTPDDRRVIVPAVGAVTTTATVFEFASGQTLQTLRELPRAPQIVQVFPDGLRVLISGYEESSAEHRRGAVTGVWELATGRRLWSAPGSAGLFGRATPDDGRWLVTADGVEPTEVQIRDSSSGTVLRRLRGPLPIRAASFSPGGEWLLSGDDAGKTRLWNTATGQLQREFEGAMQAPVVGLQISADGQQAIAVSEKGDVRVWQLPDGALQLAFAADRSFVSDVQLDGIGYQRLLTIGRQGYKLWDLQRGTLLMARNTELDWYGTAALQPGGQTLATITTNDKQVDFYDVNSRRLQASLEPEDTVLTAAAFSRNGQQMLLGSLTGAVRLMQSVPGPLLDLLHQGRVNSGSFSPDGRQIATVGNDKLLRAWDVGSGALQFSAAGHTDLITQAEYDASGEQITTIGKDGQLRLWQAGDGKLLATVPAHAVGAYKLVPSADRQWAITLPYPTGANDFTAKVWGLRDAQLRLTLPHPSFVRDAGFSPDGKQIATACGDGSLRLWSALDGHLLHTYPIANASLFALSYHSDGKALLAVDEQHGATLISLPGGQVITRLELPAPDSPTFGIGAPDGSSWAVSTFLGKIWVWHPGAAAWSEMPESNLPIDQLLYLSPQLLVSNGQDGPQRVWDPFALKLLAVVGGHDIRAWSMTAAPHGEQLLTGGRDARARLWSMAREARGVTALEQSLRCRLPLRVDAQEQLRSAAMTPCEPPAR